MCQEPLAKTGQFGFAFDAKETEPANVRVRGVVKVGGCPRAGEPVRIGELVTATDDRGRFDVALLARGSAITIGVAAVSDVERAGKPDKVMTPLARVIALDGRADAYEADIDVQPWISCGYGACTPVPATCGKP